MKGHPDAGETDSDNGRTVCKAVIILGVSRGIPQVCGKPVALPIPGGDQRQP